VKFDSAMPGNANRAWKSGSSKARRCTCSRSSRVQQETQSTVFIFTVETDSYIGFLRHVAVLKRFDQRTRQKATNQHFQKPLYDFDKEKNQYKHQNRHAQAEGRKRTNTGHFAKEDNVKNM